MIFRCTASVFPWRIKEVTVRKIIIILFFLLISQLVAARVVIIVNARNPLSAISASYLKNIFLGIKTRWEDGKIIKAVNLHPAQRVRTIFESEFLKMDSSKVQRYWIKQAIRGNINAPATVNFEEKVLQFVIQHPDSIGYLEQSTLQKHPEFLKQVKILLIQ